MRQRSALITDAARSQEDQLRTRTARYLALMALRVLSLLVAAWLIALRPPWLGLWLVLCAVGMIIVPWVAVVLANDRLPKDRHRLRRYRSTAAHPGLSAAPPQASTPDLPAGRIIDADEPPRQ